MRLLDAIVLLAAVAPVWGQGSSTWSELPVDRPIVRNGRPRFNLSIRGTVVFEDGASDEVAQAQVYCSGLVGQAYPDRRGRFNIQCSSSSGILEGILATSWVRVRFPGYETAAASLAGLQAGVNLDGGVEIGKLILHRTAAVDGRIVSVKSLAAPAAARRAFELGQRSAQRGKTEEARKNYEKAVRLYPGYAEAWLELGRLQAGAGQSDAARTSFQAAILAEPKYLRPYLQLSMLELSLRRWKELIEVTRRFIELDPVDYPQAYFFQAVGNYYLRDLEKAEKNAREAERLDESRQFPKILSLLAAVLSERGQPAAAEEYRRKYLELTAEF